MHKFILLIKSTIKFIELVTPHILDLIRLMWLSITNLYWVIDNATDELVGGSLAPWYLIEELFISKYKRLPFRGVN